MGHIVPKKGDNNQDAAPLTSDLTPGILETGTVGKIMSEVMEAEASDEFPRFVIRLVFETTKTRMNTVFRQM